MGICESRLHKSVLKPDVHIDILITNNLSNMTETDTGRGVWRVT